MSNINAATNEVESGLQNTKPVNNSQPPLEPWDIAELPLFHSPNEPPVDVEHASDEQFETWVNAHGIPIDNEEQVAGWNFDLRCLLINHCRYYGVELQFPLMENSAESSISAQNSVPAEQNSAESALNSLQQE